MKTEKSKKFVANLHDKIENVIQIRNLKQALNHGLVLRIVHRVIKFNQEAWLESYVDMNTKLRKNTQNNFKKIIAVFGKTMENVRKHSHIKLITTEARRNYLVSESNFHTTKSFSRKLISHRRKPPKTQMFMNKLDYLSLSTLAICEKVIYESRYNYVKSKYGELC